MAKVNKNIYLGPDTDIYTNKEYRYDGIHFSEKGAKSIANDWVEVILNFQKKIIYKC